MNPEDLKEMNDQALADFFDEVKVDLKQASEDQPESEWHQACFAAALIVADEIQSRRLKH